MVCDSVHVGEVDYSCGTVFVAERKWLLLVLDLRRVPVCAWLPLFCVEENHFVV